MTASMGTYVPKGREAEALTVGKDWFVIDANGQVLGRLATRIARMLIGKDKPSYTPFLDCGDHIVVINAERVKLTGNKMDQKMYRHHSGWPGGLKEVSIRALMRRRPEEVIREAVLGMLPKNKLRARRAKKLRVYAGSEALARHAGQKPQPLAL
ncbi:MAG TPA: 50S ribosomal protein L13 [Candidatus Acidoferrales bacterium]|nr:50S ribosomal protein L13 [Candidatus Acidoferrales bacterium]